MTTPKPKRLSRDKATLHAEILALRKQRDTLLNVLTDFLPVYRTCLPVDVIVAIDKALGSTLEVTK